MNCAGADADEFEQQRARLCTGVGQAGSGAVRYAAAMYFYRQDTMPMELLEIYRRCCNCDHEDPINLAEFEGVAGLTDWNNKFWGQYR